MIGPPELWTPVILFSVWAGWKFARIITYPARKSVRIIAGILGMAAGFYISIGHAIYKEWRLYHQEKALVEAFCAENPHIEVFITPEEYAEITDENLHQYAQFRYEVVKVDRYGYDEDITFRWIEYDNSINKKNTGLQYFSASKHTG